jgi:hypothetical protein
LANNQTTVSSSTIPTLISAKKEHCWGPKKPPYREGGFSPRAQLDLGGVFPRVADGCTLHSSQASLRGVVQERSLSGVHFLGEQSREFGRRMDAASAASEAQEMVASRNVRAIALDVPAVYAMILNTALGDSLAPIPDIPKSFHIPVCSNQPMTKFLAWVREWNAGNPDKRVSIVSLDPRFSPSTPVNLDCIPAISQVSAEFARSFVPIAKQCQAVERLVMAGAGAGFGLLEKGLGEDLVARAHNLISSNAPSLNRRSGSSEQYLTMRLVRAAHFLSGSINVALSHDAGIKPHSSPESHKLRLEFMADAINDVECAGGVSPSRVAQSNADGVLVMHNEALEVGKGDSALTSEQQAKSKYLVNQWLRLRLSTAVHAQSFT